MMQYPPRTTMPLLTLVTACALLGACGGGGSSSGPESSSTTVQPSTPAASSLEAAASAASTPESAASAAARVAAASAATAAAATTTAKTATSKAGGSATSGGSTGATTSSGAAIVGGAITSGDSGPNAKAQAVTRATTLNAATATSASIEKVDAGTGTKTATRLGGTGLTQVLAEACTPVVGGDFVDKALWHTRRLHPTDCAIVHTSTPQFSWSQPGDRDTTIPWTFTLRRLGTSEVVKSVQTTVPRLSMSSPLLTAGDYEWEVSYTTAGTPRVVRSNVRRFEVAGSGLVTWPAGTALATRVAQKARPRLLPTGSNFVAILAAAATGEYKMAYTALVNTAIQAKTASALMEPVSTRASYADEASYTASINTLKNNLALERRRIEAMGLMWRFTGDNTYATLGLTRLMGLAAWDPAGITSEGTSDQSNREIYLALAQGLDLYSSKLTAAQVTTIVTALKSRLAQARASMKAIDTYPYNPHPLNSLQYVVEALLYAVGSPGFSEANLWLAEAYEMFLNTATTFQTEDGGFGNGVSYGWYTMTRLPYTMAALRIMADLDMTPHPAIGQFGNFLVAFTAPKGSHMSSFGDEVHITDNYQRYAWESFRLYAALTRNPMYEWYWRAAPENVTKQSYPGAWPLMILGLGLGGSTTGVAPSSASWFFSDAGIAAMHTNTADPLRSSLYFRSSRFGSFNHAHADQNSFTLVSNGKSLLISGGYYPYYMSPHHATVNRATRYKNALTFDGGIGQAEPVVAPVAPGRPIESMDARGRLINAFDNGSWAIASGDATLAYRGYDAGRRTWTPLLDNALRSVAYNRSAKVAVIYDWATSTARTRRWELNFNAINPFTIESVTAKTVNGTASACINIYGPAGTYAATSGFAVAPETVNPSQHQLRYSVNTASNQLVSITVIREDCRSVPVTVNFNATTATVGINGVAPLVFDRGTVTVQ